ncbi:MAG: 50S ribosomal protein L4 [bacterium]|nr:50S ribosomal protein L4 [bacterium]
MATITVVDQNNNKVGDVDLNEQVFGVRPHMAAMHQVVVAQMASARAGTASTKTRSEVSYAGAKPYRQKGTGRARAGRRGSPLWRGGGTIFGPKPRDYSMRVPRKVRRLALKSALASKVDEGTLVVVDRLEMAAPKTRDLVGILGKLEAVGKTLIVTGDYQEGLALSGRNLPQVTVMEAAQLNVYDVLNVDKMVITREALEKISEALSS